MPPTTAIRRVLRTAAQRSASATIDMISDTAARDAAAARRSGLIGIALICGAVAAFACLDATAKYLGREIAVMQVVWARYTFAFLLTLVISIH